VNFVLVYGLDFKFVLNAIRVIIHQVVGWKNGSYIIESS